MSGVSAEVLREHRKATQAALDIAQGAWKVAEGHDGLLKDVAALLSRDLKGRLKWLLTGK